MNWDLVHKLNLGTIKRWLGRDNDVPDVVVPDHVIQNRNRLLLEADRKRWTDAGWNCWYRNKDTLCCSYDHAKPVPRVPKIYLTEFGKIAWWTSEEANKQLIELGKALRGEPNLLTETHTESRPLKRSLVEFNVQEELERMEKETGQVQDAEPKKELVQHPEHYTWHPAIECIRVTQHFNFNLGNVIKYVWRAGAPVPKEDRVQDLKKAQKYIEFELRRLGHDFQS